MKSPFKFLDSYTKDDREIFFGRDKEIEELYHRVFESKMMLVYGVSGTGKSSLIHCGLANKFQETDWLPLVVRRGGNIINSMAGAIQNAAITGIESQFSTPVQFKKAVRSLYLDYYKPVFIIFDQFEELFIFGDKEERKSFIQIIKSLVESDLQVRLIFVMREEYMAGVTEFERYIPTFFANRVRVEKMAHFNAIEAIIGPCKAAGISLDEGFPEALLERLSPEGADVELTYLQVFLDRIFRLATSISSPSAGEVGAAEVTFTIPLLSQSGKVSDLLGSFLEEQLKELDDPESGLVLLKSFVSIKGTKKQLSEMEILESSRSLGREIPQSLVSELLQKFVSIRILRDKDINDKYELRHDSLATKIYEKITLVEKEILEICQFLENAWSVYLKRNILLNANDLAYIAPYRDRLFVNRDINNLIEYSEKELNKEKKRIKRIAVTGFFALMTFSAGAIMMMYRIPVSGPVRNFGLAVYAIFFLPLFTYYVIKTKDNRLVNFLFLIFTFLFLGNIYVFNSAIKSKIRYILTIPLVQNDENLRNTIETYKFKTDSLYNKIDKFVSEHPNYKFPYYNDPYGIKQRSEEIISFLQDIKITIINVTEGNKSPAIKGSEILVSKITKLDDSAIPTEIMIGPKQNGRAYDVKALLQDFIVYAINTVNDDPNVSRIIRNTINLNDQRSIESDIMTKWENLKFKGQTTGFVIITLTQLQCDTKNIEYEVISYLYRKILLEGEKIK